jgi:hypothetical protein
MINKIKLFFFTILVVGFLLSCGQSKNDEDASFNAKILQIYATSVIVEPLEGEDILRSSDRISFKTGNLEEINASVNDIVTIQYTGIIRESYPAQIDPISWFTLNKY